MPKELTHILIAQDVLTRFTETGETLVAKTIRNNLAAFFWGAIIPDAFYYDMVPLIFYCSNLKKISHALHSKNGVENVERAKSLFSAICCIVYGNRHGNTFRNIMNSYCNSYGYC